MLCSCLNYCTRLCFVIRPMTMAVHVVSMTWDGCRKLSGIGGVFVEALKWYIWMVPLLSQATLCSFFGHPLNPQDT